MKYIAAIVCACMATQHAFSFNPDKLNNIVQNGTYDDYANYMKKLDIDVKDLSSKKSIEGLQKIAHAAGNTKNQLIVVLDKAQHVVEKIKEHTVTEYAKGAKGVIGGTAFTGLAICSTEAAYKIYNDENVKNIVLECLDPHFREPNSFGAKLYNELIYAAPIAAITLFTVNAVMGLYYGTTRIKDTYHNNESLIEKEKIANSLQDVTKRIDQYLAKK